MEFIGGTGAAPPAGTATQARHIWVEVSRDNARSGLLGVVGRDGETLSVLFDDLAAALRSLSAGYHALAKDGRVDVVAVDVGCGFATVIVAVDGRTVLRGRSVPAAELVWSLREAKTVTSL